MWNSSIGALAEEWEAKAADTQYVQGGLGRSPTSSNTAALIFRVSVLYFEAKSHLHFVLAFTQQR